MTPIKIFLAVLCIVFISSKVHHISSASDLSNISGVSPGDIIELAAGEYKGQRIYIQNLNGEENAPITIRPAVGAKVVFNAEGVQMKKHYTFLTIATSSYVNVEGPIEIKNSVDRCFYVYNGYHVSVDGLIVHNCQRNGIIVSGDYVTIKNSEIYNTCLENEGKKPDYGWAQALACYARNDLSGKASTNIVFENNSIHNNWGEGIDFLRCTESVAKGNKIINAYSCSLYLDASYNTKLDGNIIRVDTNKFDSKWGVADCIGISNENGGDKDIRDITVSNNVMIGCRRGVSFYESLDKENTYANMKIYHNTMWLLAYENQPLWFGQGSDSRHGYNIVKNNFMYFKGMGYSKDPYKNIVKDSSHWTYDSNYEFFSGGNPSNIFTAIDGVSCDYYSKSVDEKCFAPKINGGLYHTTQKIEGFSQDILGCRRGESSVSKGAIEAVKDCRGKGEESEEESQEQEKKEEEKPEQETEKKEEEKPEQETEKKEEEKASTVNEIKSVVITTVYRTKTGQDIFMLGDVALLGNWAISSGYPMKWSTGNVWRATFTAEQAKTINEFKFVMKDSNKGNVQWGNKSNWSFSYLKYADKIKNNQLSGSKYSFDVSTGELTVRYDFDNSK